MLDKSHVSLLVLCLGLVPNILTAQFPDTIQQPVVYPPQYRVYIGTNGSDQNSGDSLHPLATFLTALNKLDSISIGISGDIYAEAVFYAGVYHLAIEQPLNKYQIGGKRLNIGVRGIGTVQIDGRGISLSAGSGMINLVGSHISVKNFEVLYSSANGVIFGYDYNGTVHIPHDILIENVKVDSTGGHGIKVGLGPITSDNPLALSPYAERFLIRNCSVVHSVNYNDYSATQWGSSIKIHNARHVTVANCLVHDNGGEGIDLDYAQYVDLRDNLVYDNRANIYLDKAADCIIRNNLIYGINHSETGILLSMEVFTSLVSNFYVRDIWIFNNIILNTSGAISFWQGTASALQNAYFMNINIRNNTIIGKRSGTGGAINFSYLTSFGQPASNIHFSNLDLYGNIISVHPDSLAGSLVTGPLNPQPALTAGFNLWSENPVIAYNSLSDRIDTLLPFSCNPNDLSALIPHQDLNNRFIMPAPADSIVTYDYRYVTRQIDSTNAGAFELDTTPVITTHLLSNQSLANKDITVFPNPFSNSATLQSKSIDFHSTEIHLFNISGKEIQMQYEVRGNELTLYRSMLSAGIYLLIITHNTKTVSVRVAAY